MRFCRRAAARRFALALILAATAAPALAADTKKPDAKTESYRIPYQMTETKHILVRTKINGKGPFHFIIDTGAPALFLSKEAAQQLEIKPNKGGIGTLDTFEVEGGVKLEKVKAMIETPFQLVAMNKMNLPGVRLDGMLGYTVLAKFRIEYDFTRPHMVWHKLDWEPAWPRGLGELGGGMPAEMSGMIGLANFASALMGRRPDPVIVTRGYLGIELAEEAKQVRVTRVLPSSPAAEAGLKAGDQLTKFNGKAVATLAELHKLAAESAPEKDVAIEVLRAGKTQEFSLKAAKGF